MGNCPSQARFYELRPGECGAIRPYCNSFCKPYYIPANKGYSSSEQCVCCPLSSWIMGLSCTEGSSNLCAWGTTICCTALCWSPLMPFECLYWLTSMGTHLCCLNSIDWHKRCIQENYSKCAVVQEMQPTPQGQQRDVLVTKTLRLPPQTEQDTFVNPLKNPPKRKSWKDRYPDSWKSPLLLACEERARADAKIKRIAELDDVIIFLNKHAGNTASSDRLVDK